MFTQVSRHGTPSQTTTYYQNVYDASTVKLVIITGETVIVTEQRKNILLSFSFLSLMSPSRVINVVNANQQWGPLRFHNNKL